MRIRTTEAVAVVDLTARVEGFLRPAGLEAGWVNVQTRHTTTGICVNENEPLLVPTSSLSSSGWRRAGRATLTTSCTGARGSARTSARTATPTRRRSSCARRRP